MEWNRTSVRLRGFGIRQLTPWEEGIVVGTISPNWINHAQFYARSVQKRTTKRAAAFGINHVRGEVLTLVAMVSPFFCPTWKQLELIPRGMFCSRCKPGVLYYLELVTCFVWRDDWNFTKRYQLLEHKDRSDEEKERHQFSNYVARLCWRTLFQQICFLFNPYVSLCLPMNKFNHIVFFGWFNHSHFGWPTTRSLSLSVFASSLLEATWTHWTLATWTVFGHFFCWAIFVKQMSDRMID